MRDLRQALSQRVLLCDGGTGSLVQAMTLDVERDFWNCENCTDVLCLSRPDIVAEIHRGYLDAGSDVIQTNSFGGAPITLAEFDLADRAFELNEAAARIARQTAAAYDAPGRPRYVLGSIGPGTRLPSLGHIPYDALKDSFATQAAGLIAGGVDGILIETCQDPLQIKAAVNASKQARAAAGRGDLPILVQVTVETTGTLLVGADIAAAATVLHALKVDGAGLNCATGPQEMAEHVRWLSANWPGLLSVQPNAGLPELVEGKTRYPLAPADLAAWLERFLAEDGLNLIGGCCGTTPGHIAALDQMLRRRSADGWRPAPAPRAPEWQPAVASLYSQMPLRQEASFLAIGERCNANGSKKWREAQAAQDWDSCLAMAREQMGEGSHTLDICTAYVGRDEIADMTEVVSRFRGAVGIPLVIDSTELPVLAAALKLYGGKAILNSINFEDGEEPAAARLALAREHGAAVIALTIDETGMAKTAADKLAVARRLYDFAVNTHGLDPADLMFDPLTFTIATGNEDDRKLGLWTLEAIEAIARDMPACQIVLGLSNISFGLSPAARQVLNSVYLDHAIRRGLTAAIVHVSKILPLHQIPADEVAAAEDLIFDRRREGYDPLQYFISLFTGRQASAAVAKARAETAEERLVQRIIDGDRTGLSDDLADAMTRHPPLDIINNLLLDGMKTVGELFGAGKMQLPFVLQSAETMKAAVAWLEPHMERVAGQEKGRIVLATVKGDVHDIGKNLVDIILTNNGYRVINLGIKQPIATILSAAREHDAHVIGMSGLLVKSTVIMRENLEELSREQIELPVILGGAALTRDYVEGDCVKAYACGRVAYAGDAFDGLGLMNSIMTGGFDEYLAATARRREGRASRKRRPGVAADPAPPLDPAAARDRRRSLIAGPPPTPPFWGPRLVESVPVEAILPYLNERMLFQMQWGFRKEGRTLEDYMIWARRELRPVLHDLLARCKAENVLQPQAAYGYWPAAGEGDSLILFDPADHAREIARFDLPRQAAALGGACIADYVRDVADGVRDVIGLQVATVGARASDVARDWFEADRYRDYLYLHGVSVELTEALAEFIHKRIRAELGFASEDDRNIEKMLSQGYRGSRYSFGYPACPRLEDQAPLLQLLGAERLGITLSDEFQLEPEQSTSALVILNPAAKYFSV